MRAIVVDEFGGPEQLRAAEVAIPVPGPGEVLVEIYAAPVNYVDLLVVGGTYQFLPERPFIRARGRPALSVRAGVALRRCEQVIGSWQWPSKAATPMPSRFRLTSATICRPVCRSAKRRR
jgi:hypothetical protein